LRTGTEDVDVNSGSTSSGQEQLHYAKMFTPKATFDGRPQHTCQGSPAKLAYAATTADRAIAANLNGDPEA